MVSITTVVVGELILILVLKRWSLGLFEVQTGQVQPIRGTPVLVPDPKMVMSNKLLYFKQLLLSKIAFEPLRITFEKTELIYQIQYPTEGLIPIRY